MSLASCAASRLAARACAVTFSASGFGFFGSALITSRQDAQVVNALATSDGTYNPYFVTHCGDSCGLVALQGRGSVSGLVLSASRDVYGPLYVEAGVYANVKKWQVTVTQPDGTFIAEAQREHQIDFGPVVGLGLRYNGLDVGVQYIYLDDSSEGDPITPMMTGAYRGYVKVFF